MKTVFNMAINFSFRTTYIHILNFADICMFQLFHFFVGHCFFPGISKYMPVENFFEGTA